MNRIILIFIVALVVRIGFLVAWYQSGQGSHLPYDSDHYYEIGKNLADGKGFNIDDQPTSRRAPLYPLLIALILKIGSYPLGMQLVDVFLGAACCAALYLMAREMFGEEAGILASLVLTVDYLAVRQTVTALPEVLFTCLLLASFSCLFAGLKKRKDRYLFAAGVLAGLSLLTKDVLIYFFPVMLGWFFFWKEPRLTRIRRGLSFLAGVLLIVSPWVGRNILLHKQLVLITVSAGHTFYTGNNPNVKVAVTRGNWQVGQDTVYAKDVDISRFFTLEADRDFNRRAIDFIKAHPGTFVLTMIKKMGKMWFPYHDQSPLWARWATAATYVPSVILGVFGMFFCLGRWREFLPLYLLLLYTVVVHAILIAEIRYRYPVMPFIMMFAGYMLMKLRARFGRRGELRSCTVAS